MRITFFNAVVVSATPGFSWWVPCAESGAKFTNGVVQYMLRNGPSPAASTMQKAVSTEAALDPQHPVRDNGTRDPDPLPGVSRPAEIHAIDVPRGLRFLRNHGSQLGPPSELPEVDLVAPRLMGMEKEPLIVRDPKPAVHPVRPSCSRRYLSSSSYGPQNCLNNQLLSDDLLNC